MPEATRQDEIVAVGFLSASEFADIGARLNEVYAVSDDGSFDDLLKALDRQFDRPGARPFWRR